MVRTLTTLIGGILLGAFVMLALDNSGRFEKPLTQEVVRDIVNVPTMSQGVADKHRVEHYVSINTVEQVVALPSEFDRLEALYSLAGRSNSARNQGLIFEADRVADNSQRNAMLGILFSRLAETDPESALALANIERFKNDTGIEQIVWRSWGRSDLTTALSTAKSLTSSTRKNAAVQHLYAAFGFMGNDTTERIEAELGIGPDRATRRSYLYGLADESPASAVAFINDLKGRDRRLRNLDWLARYMALRNPAAALGYADLFDVTSEGQHYRNIISGTMAYDNPRDTIERLLASGKAGRRNNEYRSAMRALAAEDIDAARQYFEQAKSNEDRQMWGSLIAMQMVPDNPGEALRWAREVDIGPRAQIEMMVIGMIARTDPELAFAEAQKTTNINMREHMVSMAIQAIAENDPAQAVAYLEKIKDRNQKNQASQNLLHTWMRKDQEAALAWVLSQDEQSLGQMINQVGSNLLEYDVDSAIKLLPRLDDKYRSGLRQQIVHRLATNRSPSEAQSFVAQFQGEPEYDQLQAALISGVAQSDAIAAKQMVAQISDTDARDTAYVQVIAQRALKNPTEAASWLRSIADEVKRGAAAGQLASNWYANDPAAATRWVSNLQAGTIRDDAIMQMSYRWSESTAETERLIASIKDRDKRGQAKIRRVYSLMRTNPEEARKLLDDSDIPSYLRTQAESNFGRMRLGY